ncbi:MAG: Porphobilinogen synthase [uncultured Thermoleophilia bacterium]|uniref:Delta-aminolevulinic acid dehydratase n=1 Tax=uncultured Thermoleophilia bacterium TaxID=1497501 RepID=A0A6J4UFP9_9ACTN|nr:MAG: Porphobilinogen synthase [uncultured Thermoleophilia bacterium]
MSYPASRLRRLRRTEGLRRLVRETRLDPADLILPLFVVPGVGVRRPVGSLPGVEHLSVDGAVEDARRAADLGVGGVMLFGVPDPRDKDAVASVARRDDGLVPETLRAIRSAVPDLVLTTDLCLCGYTDHGHCGVIGADGHVENDATLPLLAEMALVHGAAGADVLAPSDMMDGRVAAVRAALDGEGLGERVAIMAHAAKFASGFYGPFRDAAHSAPSFGDRRSYQLDPANGREALREADQDELEGADILLVKPALPYLDVLARLADRTDVPLAAYQVSGEHVVLQAAAAAGALDLRRATLEALTAVRRAGARLIVTYAAKEVAGWLHERH